MYSFPLKTHLVKPCSSSFSLLGSFPVELLLGAAVPPRLVWNVMAIHPDFLALEGPFIQAIAV